MSVTRKPGRSISVSVAWVLCVVGVGAPALAQDALGDGRSLDANLQEGSGGRNQRGRDFGAELAFRNAIVTGNAPGGKSFRGEVGYTATDDFRDDLGSRDIFNFQRDSLYSGLATRDLRGISGLRVQFDSTVGGQALGGGRDLIVEGPGAGASSRQTRGMQEFSVRFDGSLRSTTEYNLLDSATPDLLGAARTEGGEQRFVAASPLQGVRAFSANDPLLNAGTSSSSLEAMPAGETEPANRVIAGAHGSVLKTLRMRTEQISGIKPVDVAPVADVPADATAVPPVDALDRMLSDIRARLAEDAAAAAEGAGADGVSGEDVIPGAGDVLGEPIVLDRLVLPEDEGSSVYSGHMSRGQDFMASGQWFDAEERFTAALGVRPGDAMAAAGRLNAQIAAGMYRSAAVNLGLLMTSFPEMVAVRFAPSLLPNPQRMEQVIGQLRDRATRRTGVGRDCALLLAYMGFQKNDRAMIDEGFREFDATEAELKLGTDPMVELLREVWMRGE